MVMSLPPQLTRDSELAAATAPSGENRLLNIVEPDYLLEVFMNNPPLGFESIRVDCGSATAAAYKLDFNLLTTLDDDAKAVRDFVRRFPFVKRFLTYPAVFVSTTVSEYANYPDQEDYQIVISSLLQEMRKRRAQFLIVRDIPQSSPLLTSHENEKAEQLMRQCQEAGFVSLEGQALAYVPIDFQSIDDYMKRLSKVRRKEFRKKLRESAHVQVEELCCGDSIFFEPSCLDTMYAMYENVFAQSEIHFDILSRKFFADLLQRASGGGRVFCYKVDGRLIGYNICFVHGGRLIDKYVGFVYPEARRANLYFLSWFYNLEYALKNGLSCYIAGWTDPAVKKALGASFTLTRHAAYVANPVLRTILKPFKHCFESDSNFLEKAADAKRSGS
jgi:predicted N-acyltransferase